jgi:hypothetical protein
MSDAMISVSAFLVATVLLSIYSWRQKQKGWIGVVEDKKIKRSTDQDGFDHESYSVIFKTDAGKKIKFGVAGKAGMDMFEIGKRYEKKPGSYIPEKLE